MLDRIVDLGTLKIRLATLADSEGSAASHSQAFVEYFEPEYGRKRWKDCFLVRYYL